MSSWTATTTTASKASTTTNTNYPTFTLQVTLGSYGYNDKIAEQLNRSCTPSVAAATTTATTPPRSFTDLAAKFLFPSSSVGSTNGGLSSKNNAASDDDVHKTTKFAPRSDEQADGDSTSSAATIGHDPFFVASVSKLQILAGPLPEAITGTIGITTTEVMWSRIRNNNNTAAAATKETDSVVMGLFIPPHITAKCLEQHYQQQEQQQQQQQINQKPAAINIGVRNTRQGHHFGSNHLQVCRLYTFSFRKSTTTFHSWMFD
jgi:hypothetical protein